MTPRRTLAGEGAAAERCQAIVCRAKGGWRTRRCTRDAVEAGLCRQHARQVQRGAYVVRDEAAAGVRGGRNG